MAKAERDLTDYYEDGYDPLAEGIKIGNAEAKRIADEAKPAKPAAPAKP